MPATACRARLPFRTHRTIAEVAETDRLLAEYHNGDGRKRERIAARLNFLLTKARLNNPLPDADTGGSAA